MQYGYQSEKLSAARSSLMLPHPQGVEASIASAFHACALAFHEFDESGLDDNARSWIAKIKGFMDTTNISDTSGAGTWVVKARTLTTDDQLELSRVVDELAHWFHRKFWSES